ncbi:unnamed protein product [Rhizophagus irregularis]|nr:unnamed protein product [Rhizophagus irregularis]
MGNLWSDVRKLEIPFITSGFPDEHKNTGWIESSSISDYGVMPDEGVKWWSFKFKHPVDPKYKEIINAPLSWEQVHSNDIKVEVRGGKLMM